MKTKLPPLSLCITALFIFVTLVNLFSQPVFAGYGCDSGCSQDRGNCNNSGGNTAWCNAAYGDRCRNPLCDKETSCNCPVPPTNYSCVCNAETSKIECSWTPAGGNVGNYATRLDTNYSSWVACTGADYCHDAVSSASTTDEFDRQAGVYPFHSWIHTVGTGGTWTSPVETIFTCVYPPTNVQATCDRAQGPINITWGDSSNEVNYNVRMTENGTKTFVLLPANTTSYSHDPYTTEPESAHTLTYNVRANGSYSKDFAYPGPDVAVACPTPLPCAAGLTRTCTDPYHLSMSWTALSGAEKYTVRVNGDPQSDWATVPPDSSTGTNLTNLVIGVTPGLPYTWSVQGIKPGETYDNAIAGGSFNCQSQGAAITCPTPTIDPPRNLVGSCTNHGGPVTLSWEDSANEVGYRVSRKVNSNAWEYEYLPDNTTAHVIAPNTTNASDTNVNYGNDYHYNVKACGDSTCSGYAQYGNEILVRCPTPSPTPTPCPKPPAVDESSPISCTEDNTPYFIITDNGTSCYSHDANVELRSGSATGPITGGSNIWASGAFGSAGTNWSFTSSALSDGLYFWRGWSRNNDPYWAADPSKTWSDPAMQFSFSVDTSEPSAISGLTSAETCGVAFQWNNSTISGCFGGPSYWLQGQDADGVWFINEWVTNCGASGFHPGTIHTVNGYNVHIDALNKITIDNPKPNLTYTLNVKAGDDSTSCTHPNQHAAFSQTTDKITDVTVPVPVVSCSRVGPGTNPSTCKFSCSWPTSADSSCFNNLTFNEYFSSEGGYYKPAVDTYDGVTNRIVDNVTDQTTLTARVRSKDEIDNISAWGQTTAFCDNGPPWCEGATVSPGSPHKLGSTVTFASTAKDTLSLSECHLNINGVQNGSSVALSGVSQACTLPWTPAADGSYTYATVIKDTDNNSTTCQSGTYCVDTVPPEVPNANVAPYGLDCVWDQGAGGYKVTLKWNAVSNSGKGCAPLNTNPYWSQLSESLGYGTVVPGWNNTWDNVLEQSAIVSSGTTVYGHVQSRDAADNQSGWSANSSIQVNAVNCHSAAPPKPVCTTTDTTATITWSDSTPPVSNYWFQMSQSSTSNPDGSYTSTLPGNPDANEWVNGKTQLVSNLTPDVKYYAHVTGWGEGPWSTTVECNTSKRVPPTPTCTVNKNDITFNWNASIPPVGSYWLQVSENNSTNADGSFVSTIVSPVDNHWVNGNSEVFSGLEYNTTYYAHVTGWGGGPWSDIISCKTSSKVPPTPTCTVYQNTITLNWGDADPVSSTYWAELSKGSALDGADGSFLLPLSDPADQVNVKTKTYSNLEFNTTYYAHVTGWTGGPWSSPAISCKTAAPPSVPTPSCSCSADGTAITYTWSPSTYHDYHLQVDRSATRNADGSLTTANEFNAWVGAGTNQKTITGLTPDVSYNAVVQATIDSSYTINTSWGPSLPSAPASCTCPAISGPTISATCDLSGTSVTLNWSGNPSFSQFWLQVNPQTGGVPTNRNPYDSSDAFEDGSLVSANTANTGWINSTSKVIAISADQTYDFIIRGKTPAGVLSGWNSAYPSSPKTLSCHASSMGLYNSNVFLDVGNSNYTNAGCNARDGGWCAGFEDPAHWTGWMAQEPALCGARVIQTGTGFTPNRTSVADQALWDLGDRTSVIDNTGQYSAGCYTWSNTKGFQQWGSDLPNQSCMVVRSDIGNPAYREGRGKITLKIMGYFPDWSGWCGTTPTDPDPWPCNSWRTCVADINPATYPQLFSEDGKIFVGGLIDKCVDELSGIPQITNIEVRPYDVRYSCSWGGYNLPPRSYTAATGCTGYPCSYFPDFIYTSDADASHPWPGFFQMAWGFYGGDPNPRNFKLTVEAGNKYTATTTNPSDISIYKSQSVSGPPVGFIQSVPCTVSNASPTSGCYQNIPELSAEIGAGANQIQFDVDSDSGFANPWLCNSGWLAGGPYSSCSVSGTGTYYWGARSQSTTNACMSPVIPTSYPLSIDQTAPEVPDNRVLKLIPDNQCLGKYFPSYSWGAVTDTGCAGLNSTPYWSQASTSLSTNADGSFNTALSGWENTWINRRSTMGANSYAGGTTIYAHVRSRDALNNQSVWSTINSSDTLTIPTPTLFPTIHIEGKFIEDTGGSVHSCSGTNLTIAENNLILQFNPLPGVTPICTKTSTSYSCNFIIDNQTTPCVPNYQTITMNASYPGYSTVEWRENNTCNNDSDPDIIVDVDPKQGDPIPPGDGISITNPFPPGGEVGVVYPPFSFTQDGGTLPVTWTANSLPPGLNLTPAGVLSGTPTQEGIYPLIIQLRDSLGKTTSHPYTITIVKYPGTSFVDKPIFFHSNAQTWIKTKDASFISRSAARSNTIPGIVTPYDLVDDTNDKYFIIGASGTTVRNGSFDVGLSTTGVSTSGWYPNANQTYITTPAFTPSKFTEYVKSRKEYKTINSLEEIDKDGIYLMTGDVTISSIPVQFNSYHIVLQVNGQVTITTPNFNPSKSIAILANTIKFDDAVTEANGIFIADTITTTLVQTGLKIKGNMIHLSSVDFVNNRTQANNTKPSIFIVFDIHKYMDLLPYLSISAYDWKKLQ